MGFGPRGIDHRSIHYPSFCGPSRPQSDDPIGPASFHPSSSRFALIRRARPLAGAGRPDENDLFALL